MQTFYEATAAPLNLPPAVGSHVARVVIIGGGYAGLSTAMSLMERQTRGVMVLEADTIGHGASGRNGGFVFGGFSLDCAKLVQQQGAARAKVLYGLTLDAVARIRQRIATHQMDCDANPSGVLLAHWFKDEHTLRALQQFMRDTMGADWRWLGREELRSQLLTERYHCALHEPNAFHFHPLKYARGEARALVQSGMAVHEHSRVTHITPQGAGWRIRTAQAHIDCEHVVVCCGGYIETLYPALARAILPIATYVMATEPLGVRLQSAMRTGAAVYDTRFAFDYYRPLADTRLLWGGRISIRDRTPDQVKALLLRDLLRVYPQLEGVGISHAWSGLMSYARHQMPQIGQLPRTGHARSGKASPGNGLWYAMGFGGHGVAPTTLAGELLAKAVRGEESIPDAFKSYGLPRTWGLAGRLAAQATYWWMQGRDAWRARA